MRKTAISPLPKPDRPPAPKREGWTNTDRVVEPRAIGLLSAATVFLFIVLALAPQIASASAPLWISFVLGLIFAGLFGALMTVVTRRLLERDRAAWEERRSERVGFQQRELYLAALAEAESHLLADTDGEGNRAALVALGRAAGASRASVFFVRTDPRDHSLIAVLGQSWHASGIPASAQLHDIKLSQTFARWLEPLSAGDVIDGPTSGLPPSERAALESHGIRSLVVLPIGEAGKTPRGVLLIENPKTPSQDHLRAAAAAFLHAEARREIERATRRQALHDPLTDLPNRLHLREELERRLGDAEKAGTGVAVVFLDLDRFKQINDTLGHDFGDRYLQYVVRHRLHPCLAASDFLARVGGDEFVLILSAERQSLVHDATQRAGAILRSLMLPIALEGQELYISTSIGISGFPTDGADVETLMKHADISMYAVKEAGKNNYRFFESAMLEGATGKLRLEADLRHALDPRSSASDVFLVHFQPQVDIRTGEMVGLEALARWQHPERGLIPPEEFVGLAEETGLILPLGEHILRAACRQGAEWIARGHKLRIAVNLSAAQLRERELVLQVHRVLNETKLPPDCLELEFTETAMMKDIPGARAVMADLKNLGVWLSIDDFGAGASSVAQLRDFPFDSVKIEKMFVKALLESDRDRELTRALISLARAMDANIVAEGVESMRQCEILAEMGCTLMQGHFFSLALTADELERRFFSESLPKAA